MFEELDKTIIAGVSAGLDNAFRQDGPLAKSIGDAFDTVTRPLRTEITRLRRLLYWRNPAKPPTHEQPVLVSVKGDMYFAVWRPAADGDEAYWDSDIEYGGTVIEPDGWFEVPGFDRQNGHCFPTPPHPAGQVKP